MVAVVPAVNSSGVPSLLVSILNSVITRSSPSTSLSLVITLPDTSVFCGVTLVSSLTIGASFTALTEMVREPSVFRAVLELPSSLTV